MSHRKPDFPEGLSDDVLKQFIEGTREDRAAVNAQFGEILFHNQHSDELSNWLWSLGMEASGSATAASVESLRGGDLRAEMADMTVPTTMCRGVNDEVCLSDITTEGHEDGIENAELVQFENSGHGLFYEEKDKLTGELLDFVG